MSVHSSRSIPQALSTWKEIAAYLGKGVRTAQRYEQELQLPVRRFDGIRASVLAIPDELDLWVKRRTLTTRAGEKNARALEILAAVRRSITESVELRDENRALRKLHASAIHDLAVSIHALTKTIPSA
jgi:hypothetical protein